MKIAVARFGLLIALAGGVLTLPSAAANLDLKAAPAPSRSLPFPRSEQAQSVWAGGACWTRCGAYCEWGEASCLKTEPQGRCLELTDRCDRYCQTNCRTEGGPLLPLDF